MSRLVRASELCLPRQTWRAHATTNSRIRFCPVLLYNFSYLFSCFPSFCRGDCNRVQFCFDDRSWKFFWAVFASFREELGPFVISTQVHKHDKRRGPAPQKTALKKKTVPSHRGIPFPRHQNKIKDGTFEPPPNRKMHPLLQQRTTAQTGRLRANK